MDYEKAYKEALERARALNEGKTTGAFGETVCEYIFPELKESENERIRKQILSFLKEFEHDHYRNLDFSSWIAWLEKQSEQSSNILHEVNEEPEEQREIFCEWESSDAIWHDVAFYHADTKTFWNGEQKIENVVKWAYTDEMLEKQGKPKWSVEDKELCQDALDAFEALVNDLNPSEDWGKLYDWLKSIKQRIEG